MTPNDLNFGLPAWGAGASNPVAAWMQASASPSAAPAASTPNWLTGSSPGGMGGLGFNLDTGKLVLGGLQTIGSLWQAFEANKLAKEQFKFGKDFANVNLANSIQSYNTQVDNIGRSRAVTEGQSPEQAAAWLATNKLPDRKIG
jgi:hypothetical protein